MAKPIIAGTNKPIPEGVSFSWDPRCGFKPGTVYRGPQKVMYGLANILAFSGTAFSFHEANGMVTITLQGGGTVDPNNAEVPIDSWQLLGNEIQKDVYHHPNSLALENNKLGTLAAIKQDVLAYNSLTATFSGGNLALPTAAQQSGAGYAPFTFGSLYGQAMQLFSLLTQEITHFALGQPVLKHTQTVSDRYTGSGVNLANSENIYTTDQLLAECAAFPYPLPPLMVLAVKATPVPAAQTGFLFGWRKLPTTFVTAANFKIEISTEYVSDLWSTYLYSPVGTAAPE